jgi:Leucine-rich repeat (LRR) protein
MIVTKEWLERKFSLKRTHITLNYKKITKIKKDAFISFKKLDTLSIASDKINDISFLKNLKNLRALYLSFNRIKSLKPIYKLKKLKTLYIEQYNINLNKIISLKILIFFKQFVKNIKFFYSIMAYKQLSEERNKIKKTLSYYTF